MNWPILQPHVLPWIALVVGLIVGSFANVVIYRLPKIMEREWREQCAELCGSPINEVAPIERLGLATPRSRCPHCGHAISPMENIPILSFLFLGGRCRECKTKISYRYPTVELLSGISVAYCAWRFGPSITAISMASFVLIVMTAALIDLDTQYLPDTLTLPLVWLGLLSSLWGWGIVDIQSSVLGAVAGYLSLWSIYWVFKWVTGKEGMGYGDFKLLAAIGAWVGWASLPLVILISSVLGSIVGITLIIISRHAREVPIPFGPYLGFAGIVTVLWGTFLNPIIWSRIPI